MSNSSPQHTCKSSQSSSRQIRTNSAKLISSLRFSDISSNLIWNDHELCVALWSLRAHSLSCWPWRSDDGKAPSRPHGLSHEHVIKSVARLELGSALCVNEWGQGLYGLLCSHKMTFLQTSNIYSLHFVLHSDPSGPSLQYRRRHIQSLLLCSVCGRCHPGVLGGFGMLSWVILSGLAQTKSDLHEEHHSSNQNAAVDQGTLPGFQRAVKGDLVERASTLPSGGLFHFRLTTSCLLIPESDKTINRNRYGTWSELKMWISCSKPC